MADQAMRACLNVATAGVALGRSGHARQNLEGEEEQEEAGIEKSTLIKTSQKRIDFEPRARSGAAGDRKVNGF